MDPAEIEKKRAWMLDAIRADAKDTAGWTGRDAFSDATMAAMTAVPRHEFVREKERVAAYVNRPQAIGHGQTISQPTIVALMTDLLDLGGHERVLEIGTGSGYQAAVLSEVLRDNGGHIFTIEIVVALAEGAAKVLERLGYDNVTTRRGDGFKGWPEQAPFDAIIVTAAPPHIPDALVAQLKPGGRMILPIGRAYDRQTLTLVQKDITTGQVTVESVLPVAFVPMVEEKEESR